MRTVIRYCRGCNEEIVSAEDDPRCPVCRQAVTLWDLSPTIELGQTEVYPAGKRAAKRRAPPRELIGRPFAGYLIESALGQGGMAWVFLAQHQTLQRPCAIKILRTDLHSTDQDFLQLFIAEARAAASVVHPHIVTVHNIGEVDRYHFIELEYVPGASLQHLAQAEQRLAPTRATYLLLQACEALAAAHRQGLVHRDFKPANVLVAENDYAKLADFGLAKRIATGRSIGLESTLVGTPYYMAPELFDGHPATPASDVYAVGVSYYQLLTGQFPFVERNLAALVSLHKTAPVPDPRAGTTDVTPEMAQVVQQCLAKSPTDRPRDGDALGRALRTILLRSQDLRSLVDEARGADDWECREEGRRLTLEVPLSSGRQQRVVVEECDEGPGGEPIVRIYSVCARAQESFYRAALELNARLAHGSLAIEELDGEPCFVMLNCYPRCTCDAEEIRRSVQEISQWADRIELALTGQDRH
jgi:eukaryotic-like serine/threonine-protein kinase